MSKDEKGQTPLQAAIKETIEAHPVLDDKEIAHMVFHKRYPEETYTGKDPSHAYVGKIRKRLAIMGKPPEFIIEAPDEREEPAEEDEIEPSGEGEEPVPEIPFEEDFEPPLEIDEDDPLIEIDPVDGFTRNDTEFILCFTFDKFADWSGYDGWRFKQDDQGKLIDKNEIRFAGLTHRIMDKYMPEILDLYFLEFMFCYTGIMLLGSKAKGYYDWKKGKKPIIKKQVESTINEDTPPETPEAIEIPDDEETETPTNVEPLPPGAKAHGEGGFKDRLARRFA